jgi:hypothetical protein
MSHIYSTKESANLKKAGFMSHIGEEATAIKRVCDVFTVMSMLQVNFIVNIIK